MNWRSEVRDTFKASLDTFAATLGEPPRIHKARPASLADNRTIYIAGIAENILHTSGVRQRTCEVTLMVCVHLGENSETTDEAEDLADALIDWLTDNYGLTGATTVQEPIRSVSAEVAEGGGFIPAVAVTSRALIQEGRT